MAEVIATFSALSSILQLVDFAWKISSHASAMLKEGTERDDAIDVGKTVSTEYPMLLHDLNHYETKYQEDHDQGRQFLDKTTQSLVDSCESEVKKLVGVLESLQVDPILKRRPSPVKLYKIALLNLRSPGKRREIDKHRSRLHELNGLLGTSLLRAMMSSHEEKLREALDIIASMNKKLDRSEEFSDVNKLISLNHEHVKTMRKVDREIMDSLQDISLNERWRSITEAYSKTFVWALENHDDLNTWLRHGSGIFWITGKAGSGKSTLMKYLADSQQTRVLLESWAESNELVIASHYFWYVGNYLQKSIKGLLQSVLLQLFRVCPLLCRVAFPEHYPSILPPQPGELSMSYQDLLKALENIGRMDHEAAGIRVTNFCLFIDGLDEYDGPHLELIQLLMKVSGNPSIKLCVSSRPWNAFRKAFELSVPFLQLEDLTRADISTFVHGEFMKYRPIDAEVTELIEEITDRSEGVFLWVHLAVKTILSGFAEHEPIWILKRRVQEFPQDLEEFFRSILSRVDTVYRDHTYQALKLAFMLIRGNHAAHGLEPCWVLFYLLRQTSYGIQRAEDITSLVPQLRSQRNCENMYEATRTFLSASCKDLLYLVPPQKGSSGGEVAGSRREKLYNARSQWRNNSVQFLHRTVYDFLNTEAMQNTMTSKVPGLFLSHRIFHLLRLAREVFIWEEEPQVRLKELRRIHDFSVLREHPDRTPAFLSTLESILVLHTSVLPYDLLPHEALPTLVAFGLRQYLKKFIENMIETVGHGDMLLSEALECFNGKEILRSALGLNDINRFTVEKVDLEIIAILLDCPEVWKLSANLRVAYTTFLKLWADSGATLHKEVDIRRLWEIAKLFLLRRAISYRAVEGDFGSGVETDAVFFRARVPLSWLPEAGLPRLLPDRADTLMEYASYSFEKRLESGDLQVNSKVPGNKPRSVDSAVIASLFGITAATSSLDSGPPEAT